MGINLKRINDSPLIISLVSTLGRMLPLQAGHSLADFIARQVASRRNSHMIRAVRANQWVARGETLETEVLDRAVSETLRNSTRSIFDLYHYIQNEQATRRLIILDPTIQQLIQRTEFEPRGLVIAGLHLSNFDLILQWLCWEGLRPLVLTIPDPQGGRRTEYERRKKAGMNLVPASVSAIRQALHYLQQGGVVMTGIDRPIPEPKACPRFFGRPAALPMHHVFLAAKAQVPVMVMVTIQQPDGKYHVMTSEPIQMDPHPDREVEALQNAEKVLSVAARYIRKAPQQWSVSLPVWPDAMYLVP
jgi:lauroyl/myristoyl acyltransferase